MSLIREKIEHLEHWWGKNKPWKNFSYSRKYLKNQMNRYLRRKPIEEDEVGGKRGRKPYRGWEY